MNIKAKSVKSDFFKGIYQWANREYDVKLPIFYYDCSALSAVFTASTKLVKQYLPVKDLHPVEIIPGRCLVTVSGFEYRESDIGPYNEFSVAIVVRRGRKPLPLLPVLSSLVKNCFHVYIVHLPVTSERARRGGVEMGGYPKFLADINVSKNRVITECRLSLKKNHIVTLRGKNLKTSGFGRTRYVIYTCLDGCLLTSNLFLNPIQFAQSVNGNTAVLETGSDHALCDFLNGIKLGKKPLVYQNIPSFEAVLCASKNIIDN